MFLQGTFHQPIRSFLSVMGQATENPFFSKQKRLGIWATRVLQMSLDYYVVRLDFH